MLITRQADVFMGRDGQRCIKSVRQLKAALVADVIHESTTKPSSRRRVDAAAGGDAAGAAEGKLVKRVDVAKKAEAARKAEAKKEAARKEAQKKAEAAAANRRTPSPPPRHEQRPWQALIKGALLGCPPLVAMVTPSHDACVHLCVASSAVRRGLHRQRPLLGSAAVLHRRER
jgi:sRNA-binding protein